METFDVVIVGAGPAGLECARVLSGSGASVLVIERRPAIGPKTCAGGLLHPCGIELPEQRTRCFPRETYRLGRREIEITSPAPLRTIDRIDLASAQLAALEGSPRLTILQGTSVRSIGEDEVATDAGPFRFGRLVGADGAHSVVRRRLGLESRYTTGMYHEVGSASGGVIYRIEPRGAYRYIWEFPHTDSTSIGIYFEPHQLKPSAARRVLEGYLASRGFPVSRGAYRAARVQHLYRGCLFGNIFLAGEAAGLVLRGTGEGIAPAILSGREIARRILDPAYSMPELRRFLGTKRRDAMRLRLYDTFPSLRPFFLLRLVRLRRRGKA